MGVELSKAVTVITGAGSGIGRAVAHSVAKRGSRVLVTDIDLHRAMAVAGELGPQALLLSATSPNWPTSNSVEMSRSMSSAW